jgi:hypothetical protein
VADERIIAVGLLTAGDVELLGPTFSRLWPVDETPCFSGMLRAIDEADRDLRYSRDYRPRMGSIDRE